jgi:TPR repeat protein
LRFVQGNVSALNNLGWCLLFGVGVMRDEAAAVNTFSAAIKAGCVNA